MAIFDDSFESILLGRKATEDKWRIIGGFATPESDSYEEDAAREALEEVNVRVYGIHYLGSYHIDDWRYRREVDKIKTILFVANTDDPGVPGDDVVDVKWFFIDNFQFSDFLNENIMEPHRELVRIATLYASARNFQPSDNPYGVAIGYRGDE